MNLESVGQSNKWITNEEVYIQTLLASSPLTLFGGFLVSALDYYIYVRYLWGMNLFRLIIYVFGGLLVTGSIYAFFVYSPSQPPQETQLALVSEPIAQVDEPTNTECEVVECPTFVCEPEVIIKEIPVEKVIIKTEYIDVPVEKIVEVPVDRIIYQDRIVYRDIIREVYLPRQCPQAQVSPQSSADQALREQYLQDLDIVNQQIIDLTKAMNKAIEQENQRTVLRPIINVSIQAIRDKAAPVFEQLYLERQQLLDWLTTH